MDVMERVTNGREGTNALFNSDLRGDFRERGHGPDVIETKRDTRFEKLLGRANWMKLPAPIRKRFGKRFKQGQSVAYQGVVTDMKMSRFGWAFAQAARIIGAPLPFEKNSVDQPAVVIVTEDKETNGQFWIRQYGREKGFPQTVHSSKRFAGPTGLEEYIGYGIGMALKLEATAHALFFKSEHYFLQVFGQRVRLPKWLVPLALTIGHHELGDHRFAFTLELKSKLFGKMIEQHAVFADPTEMQQHTKEYRHA